MEECHVPSFNKYKKNRDKQRGPFLLKKKSLERTIEKRKPQLVLKAKKIPEEVHLLSSMNGRANPRGKTLY